MASMSEDEIMGSTADLEDDLFGDDDDEPGEKARELSDHELDSGDDENRMDRAPRTEAEEVDLEDSRDARVLETTVWRHPIPKPADGEYNALRLPTFLGIEPRPFDSDTFQPPESDHHLDTKSANFSASAVSSSTIRYRKTPNGKLESNTVLHKWSDGTTTLSIGDQHYELQTASLAPSKEGKNYQSVMDSHQYLASPSIASQMLVMMGHMTNHYTVRPNKDIQDDALEKLQKNLAAATRGGTRDDKNGPQIISNTEDPEMQKKKAEIAEKERLRAQRRRETAAEKANQPRSVLGGRGGLNVDDLEGRAGRRAPGPGRKISKPRRRRADYDSDDDLPRGGRNREDEYDKEDDFLASSDEDMEEGVDEEEEEILDDDSDRDAHRSKKQKTSKSRPEEISDADADAEADLDDDEAPFQPITTEPANRSRKRNIIEDDDDE
ncbi:hypothetical protein PZA11_001275 [Diplocarpon coronariae]|uniref:Uncharacterized protein n=1 Tax=Diplocarpon coronariae TaxID=2795749 RepID=A0A218ZBL9_9HELO|nr:hypothetical protein JHW43_004306 [Diplocarpon mali]OWP04903.1 hypothetical protein B2J93_4229 [Marssonina coronariae]